MKGLIVFALALIAGQPALSQSFTCNYSGQPACLGYGETVCSSNGKCVDDNAVCFDSYQCDYEGFTCKSNVTDCINDYNDLLRKHNALVDEYNDLAKRSKALANDYDNMKSCVALASSLSEARLCY